MQTWNNHTPYGSAGTSLAVGAVLLLVAATVTRVDAQVTHTDLNTLDSIRTRLHTCQTTLDSAARQWPGLEQEVVRQLAGSASDWQLHAGQLMLQLSGLLDASRAEQALRRAVLASRIRVLADRLPGELAGVGALVAELNQPRSHISRLYRPPDLRPTSEIDRERAAGKLILAQADLLLRELYILEAVLKHLDEQI